MRTLANEIVPTLCGSAFKNKGVQAMLDAVIDYMPSPDRRARRSRVMLDDAAETEAERHAADDEPFAALAFKIATDPFVGTLTFFRVYSGVLNSGDTVYNPVKGHKERIGRIAADARQQPRGDQGSARRRYRRRGGPEGRHHRRYPVRPRQGHHRWSAWSSPSR